MRKATLSTAGLFLLAGALSAAPCTPSPSTLCLNASRFEVEVSWRDSRGRTGAGQAVPITADTGYFWFFSEANIELVVKVLDARSINQKYWVFFGALSSVEYDLVVTDTTNGRSKTYHNPLGQFASVGDTSAFDPSAISPTHETVSVEGASQPGSFEAVQAFIDAPSTNAPSAAAFTPCPETHHGFYLNGCRFHLELSWRDARGRTGIGQPVQLTNDTGYFWFFSPANVELMVKVLDARSINGKFWVFFGALSNVQYSVTVRDTVTRASKSYENPSGTFASVGDTEAFSGGYSVKPVPNPGLAVSVNLDPTGGTVTAAGADGTVFMLEVPAGALSSSETVTLTPVSRIDRFPFSGGLIGGVEIEPAGLDLFAPATLTIQPPSSPPPHQTLPYSYSRGGEDFILYPRDADTSLLRLRLVKFAGYGAGRGSPGDAESQAANTPAGPLNPYLQRYSLEVFRRASGVISQAELEQRGNQIYREAFEQLARAVPIAGASTTAAMRGKGIDTCPPEGGTPTEDFKRKVWFDNMWNLIAMERQRQLAPHLFEDRTDNEVTYILELANLIMKCVKEAFDRCVSRNDPFEFVAINTMVRQLQNMGIDDPAFTTFTETGYLERCLRFEVAFESELLAEYHYNAGPRRLDWTERQKYRAANVPLRVSSEERPLAGTWYFTGACSLLPDFVTWNISAKDAHNSASCTIPCSGGRGWFNVDTAWIDISGDDPSLLKIKMLYYPGDPDPGCAGTCAGAQIEPDDFLKFSLLYFTFHVSDLSPVGYGSTNLYMAKDWIPLRIGGGPSQTGEFVAMKLYQPEPVHVATIETHTETTWIYLKHTPDKPAPTCQSGD